MSLYTLNNSLINPDNSHLGTTLFTDKTVPFGPHTLPPSGSMFKGLLVFILVCKMVEKEGN